MLFLPFHTRDWWDMLTMLTADDKTVCSCSGKTVWQEREEQRDRGML